MKLNKIISFLENLAHPAYQESYDNAGLITGSPEMEITGIVVCLDSTEDVIDEAIKNNCNLVVAHHPIVFSGLKKITGKNYVERIIIKAIKKDIAIYASHTNLDNIQHGVSARMAMELGLVNCRVLAPKTDVLRKLITFCPTGQAEKVRQALFAAGAGKIGNYDECSFNSQGSGTFRASDEANPFIGEKNKRHQENEIKIETIYPVHLEKEIVRALIGSHPYEEVAYDLLFLKNQHKGIGAGIIGEISKPMDEILFLNQVKRVFSAGSLRYTALNGRKIKKVALCGGSGSFLLEKAIVAGADIFITSDFKYHQFFDTDNKIVIADVGHYESEQFTIHLLGDELKKKFPKFAIRLTKRDTNPIKYL